MTRDSHGEYMDERNVLEGINPAIKLGCLLILTVSFVFAESLLAHIFTLTFLSAVFYLAQIGPASVKTPLIRLLPLMFFVFALDLCFASPETAFYSLWIFKPSLSGAIKGIGTAAKIAEIAVLFELFSRLTEPMSLCAPLTAVFRPLSLLGISPEHIALTLASSFAFFDLLQQRFDEIAEIQKNRGRRNEKRGRFDTESNLRLLRPALYCALCDVREKALLVEARGVPESLAGALKARMELSMYDYCAMVVSTAFFAVQLIIF